MYNDNEKNVNEIIDYFSSITKSVPDEIAMNAMDLPDNFAFVHLLGLTGEGGRKARTAAVMLACKLGYMAGSQAVMRTAAINNLIN